MTTARVETHRGVSVEISPDHLQAWVTVSRADAGATGILGALIKAKINVDETVMSRVRELADLVSREGVPRERFLVAEGRAPEEGKDGALIWDEEIEKARRLREDGASVNYYEASNVVTVKEGAVIGRIVPPTPGRDGIDVYGAPIKAGHHPVEIQLGEGVERSQTDRSVVVSNTAGRVIFKYNILSVRRALEIVGDVDFKTGSISSPVDIHISGDIRDNFEVRSERSITVGGCVEQATVVAQGDVIVRKGILGRGNGTVTAGGDCVIKFCKEAVLIAHGDVKVAKAVMHSSVYTDGRLRSPHGCLIGGSLYAREGAEIESAGNETGVPTEIIVGIHPRVLRQVQAIDEEILARQRAAAELEMRARPLVNCVKRLTAEQKKRLAELLARLKTVKQAIADAEQRREALLAKAQPAGRPCVIVSRIIHEGVSIRIGHHVTHFTREMRGPIQIESRKGRATTRLVAVNQLSGSVTDLPTALLTAASDTAVPDSEASPAALPLEATQS